MVKPAMMKLFKLLMMLMRKVADSSLRGYVSEVG